jgi:hypothetical protein
MAQIAVNPSPFVSDKSPSTVISSIWNTFGGTMHDQPSFGQKRNKRGKKTKKSQKNFYPSRGSKSDSDEHDLKPVRKTGKDRVSWKSRKAELEQMDIEDLKNYLLETEF